MSIVLFHGVLGMECKPSCLHGKHFPGYLPCPYFFANLLPTPFLVVSPPNFGISSKVYPLRTDARPYLGFLARVSAKVPSSFRSRSTCSSALHINALPSSSLVSVL